MKAKSNTTCTTLSPSPPSPTHLRSIKVDLSLSVDSQPLINKKMVLFEEFTNTGTEMKYIASKFPKGKPLSSEHQLVKQLFKFTDGFSRNASSLAQSALKSTPSELKQKLFIEDEDNAKGLRPKLGVKSRHGWFANKQVASRVKTVLESKQEEGAPMKGRSWFHNR